MIREVLKTQRRLEKWEKITDKKLMRRSLIKFFGKKKFARRERGAKLSEDKTKLTSSDSSSSTLQSCFGLSWLCKSFHDRPSFRTIINGESTHLYFACSSSPSISSHLQSLVVRCLTLIPLDFLFFLVQNCWFRTSSSMFFSWKIFVSRRPLLSHHHFALSLISNLH